MNSRSLPRITAHSTSVKLRPARPSIAPLASASSLPLAPAFTGMTIGWVTPVDPSLLSPGSKRGETAESNLSVGPTGARTDPAERAVMGTPSCSAKTSLWLPCRLFECFGFI